MKFLRIQKIIGLRIFFSTLLILWGLSLKPYAAAQSNAQSNAFVFNSKYGYDVYFKINEQETAVLNNIELIRFEQLGDKTFLVVKSNGFNFKDAEGFVSLDSITVILPNDSFHIKKIDKTKINF